MAAKKHGLIFVDDEEDIIDTLYDAFIDDYNVFKSTSPKEALEIIKKEDIALVISDQRMPEMTGTELLEKVYDLKPETIRVLLTGYADVNAAVDAINKGAVHKYVEKPWNDDDLQEMVKNLVEIYEDSKEKLSMLSKVEDIITNEISFRGILDNIKEGACAIGEDGNVFFANMKALSILGYENNDEVKSKKVFEIGSDELEEFKNEFKEKKKVKGKIVTAKGKESEPIDVLLTPIFTKEDKPMVGVIFQGI